MSLVRDRERASTRFGPAWIRVERFARRIRERGLLVTAGFAVLVLVACGPSGQPEPALRIRVAPTPPTVGTARVIVQVLGEVARPVSATVSGRPLPNGAQGPPGDAHESGPNAFSLAAFDFREPGPWRMVAEVSLSDGTVLRDSTDLTVVEGLSRPQDPPGE